MNTSIKVAFKDLYTILEANKNKKVSTILPELIELMSKQGNSSGLANTFIKDDEGNVTHVFCYYHKLWEDVTIAEYGSKKGTSTGLNSMCKEGVSNWTKQQRAKKAGESGLLAKLSSGEITIEDLPAEEARLAEEAKAIKPRADDHGTTEV